MIFQYRPGRNDIGISKFTAWESKSRSRFGETMTCNDVRNPLIFVANKIDVGKWINYKQMVSNRQLYNINDIYRSQQELRQRFSIRFRHDF